MKVYVVTDSDTHEAHAFAHRKNAINFMYRKCKDWGSVLYICAKVRGFYQYTEFSKLYSTEQEQLAYLYQCEEIELNDIFESYWCIQECKIEDAD